MVKPKSVGPPGAFFHVRIIRLVARLRRPVRHDPHDGGPLNLSQTRNPSGSWNVYAFDMSMGTTNFADFTQIGLDGSAVYFSANMFNQAGTAYDRFRDATRRQVHFVASWPAVDACVSRPYVSHQSPPWSPQMTRG